MTLTLAGRLKSSMLKPPARAQLSEPTAVFAAPEIHAWQVCAAQLHEYWIWQPRKGRGKRAQLSLFQRAQRALHTTSSLVLLHPVLNRRRLASYLRAMRSQQPALELLELVGTHHADEDAAVVRQPAVQEGGQLRWKRIHCI